MADESARTRLQGEAEAKKDLGTARTKPYWLQQDHSLPYNLLSDDEFEIYCFLLLQMERDPLVRDLYYLGKTGDLGRDIVRVLYSGDVELIQCKRYEDKVGLREVREEFAKLYVNVFRGNITPRPQRVVFYVSSDLTPKANDLLLDPAIWIGISEESLEEYLGAKPEADLVAFAQTWRPTFATAIGVSITQRSQLFNSLVDEFFSVRKVVDTSAVDAVNNKIDKLIIAAETKNIAWAPEGMAQLLGQLKRDYPGLSFDATTTSDGTMFAIRPSEPDGRIPVQKPHFPDTEAGRRGAEKFRTFVDEGREIELEPGEFDWQAPVNHKLLPMPPDASRAIRLKPLIPPHKVPVELVWLDKNGAPGAEIRLTYFTLVRSGRLEGEMQLKGGRLAAALSFVFKKSGATGDHQLTFELNLPSVRAEDARRTLELLQSFRETGTLRICDADEGRPLFEISGARGDVAFLEKLTGAHQLLGWLVQINRELGLDIRYPATDVGQDDGDTAELLAAAIEHGGTVAAPNRDHTTSSFDLTKQDAMNILREWQTGKPLTMSVTRTAPFELFGVVIPLDRGIGDVTMHLEDVVSIRPLTELEEELAALPDDGLLHMSVAYQRTLYEFARWKHTKR